MSKAERPWWDVAFAEPYRALYAHRDDAAADQEIAGLLPRLRTAPGPILDLGCGHGRHLEALRRYGLVAYGLDFSTHLLNDGRQRSACAGRLVRGDMRQPPLTNGWGAVLLLFTAFGYFDDATNQAVLERWSATLAKGGWLVLDLPDADHLAATLCPTSQRILTDGTTVTECRRLVDQHVEKSVQLLRPDGSAVNYTERVRLYRADDISHLAASAGLHLDACWPSLRGPQANDHRTVWWLARL